jgi:hypothetical protein
MRLIIKYSYMELYYLGLLPLIFLMIILILVIKAEADDLVDYLLACCAVALIVWLAATGLMWFLDSIKEAKAHETTMTASVPKSDYYVCLDGCAEEFIK